MVISFNRPTKLENQYKYVQEVVANGVSRGDGIFSKRCEEWVQNRFLAQRALLVPSCTAALEMAALLCGINEGDEVIMPSYTFCSTANAFALRGAKIVFVDVRPDTMNIDESLIEAAITDRTKAIVPVHYAGIACEMDVIMDIARRHNLFVVEDAAQGVMSTYKGKALGTMGDFGCYSFHETKNYSMGEGGALLVNRSEFVGRAEILREKGTNRSQFLRGQVDKYSWVDIGSSYLPSDFAAANLYAQLEIADEINADRLKSWELYYRLLKPLEKAVGIELPKVPPEVKHNAHLFYIKTKNLDERTNLTAFLKERQITALFHYIPLHSSRAGRKYGRFHNEDKFTTRESEKLLRLPMWYGISSHVEDIVENIFKFYDINFST